MGMTVEDAQKLMPRDKVDHDIVEIVEPRIRYSAQHGQGIVRIDTGDYWGNQLWRGGIQERIPAMVERLRERGFRVAYESAANVLEIIWDESRL